MKSKDPFKPNAKLKAAAKAYKKLTLADNKESKDGTWEYTHFPRSKSVKFMYWRKDDDTPSITLNITIEEFNDLIKFAGKLKPLRIVKSKHFGL